MSVVIVIAARRCLFTMTDAATPVSSSLPPPPHSSANAPGQQPYSTDNNGAVPSQNNGQGNPHMPPPPLAPVIIPQNTNPIPTAISSPLGGAMSAGSGGGYVRRAAPEPNKRALYVGGLDPRVTEEVLRQIFETAGHVQNVKIIPDKNVSDTKVKCFHLLGHCPSVPCLHLIHPLNSTFFIV